MIHSALVHRPSMVSHHRSYKHTKVKYYDGHVISKILFLSMIAEVEICNFHPIQDLSAGFSLSLLQCFSKFLCKHNNLDKNNYLSHPLKIFDNAFLFFRSEK